jgi:hypothetical protein
MFDEATYVEQGHATGAQIVLRPVLEPDLAELWPVLAQNPYEYEPTPWTHQRLKQKFENKEEPGLWGRLEKYYTVVRKQGGVVGFLRQEVEDNIQITWNTFHLAAGVEDSAELYRDILRTFRAHHQRWSAPLRISFITGSKEQAKHAALEAEDFMREIVFERTHYYQGELVDDVIHTWLSPDLDTLGADDGPVAGEEAS